MAFASASANAGFSMNLGRYFFPGNFFLGKGYGNVKGKTRQGFSVALPGPSVDLSGSIRKFQWFIWAISGPQWPSAKLV